MAVVSNHVAIQQHPGSSRDDIEDEPEWGTAHQHRVGYRNRQDRLPGVTHTGDERNDEAAENRRPESNERRKTTAQDSLINFRDAIHKQKVSDEGAALGRAGQGLSDKGYDHSDNAERPRSA